MKKLKHIYKVFREWINLQFKILELEISQDLVLHGIKKLQNKSHLSKSTL